MSACDIMDVSGVHVITDILLQERRGSPSSLPEGAVMLQNMPPMPPNYLHMPQLLDEMSGVPFKWSEVLLARPMHD